MKFSATILLGFVALSNAFAFLQHTELQSSLQVSGVGAQSFKFDALGWISRAKSHKSTKSHKTKKIPKPSHISHTDHEPKPPKASSKPSHISHTSHEPKPPGPGFKPSYINHTNPVNKPPGPGFRPSDINDTSTANKPPELPHYSSIEGKLATCKHSCTNGKCISSNQCKCNSGYKKKPLDPYTCEPHCSRTCINARCTSPNSCRCKPGYRKSPNQSNVCEPICPSGCQHGHCDEPNKCKCNNLFVADKDAQGNSICVDACTKLCIHGTCHQADHTCSCNYGWAGIYCQQPTVCSISLTINSLVKLKGSAQYEESTGKETWRRPICDNGCMKKITNETKCVGQHNKPAQNVTCFVNFNDACNADAAAKYNRRGAQETEDIVLATFFVVLIIVAIVVIYVNKERSVSEDSEPIIRNSN